jgi:hypothetical protein
LAFRTFDYATSHLLLISRDRPPLWCNWPWELVLIFIPEHFINNTCKHLVFSSAPWWLSLLMMSSSLSPLSVPWNYIFHIQGIWCTLIK